MLMGEIFPAQIKGKMCFQNTFVFTIILLSVLSILNSILMKCKTALL